MADRQLGQAFAVTLKVWFKANDWPQSITEVVARSKGNKTGPWASQISHAMAGKHEPKVPFFLALGWFNQVVCERDFGGLTDRRALDRLRNAEPLCHDDGRPYDATDFFKLYAGLAEPPKEYLGSEDGGPVFTQEMVDAWKEGLRAGFKEACIATLSPPAAIWAVVSKRAIDVYKANQDDLDFTREVLAGIRDVTVFEGARMRKKYSDTNPLANAIVDVIEEAGGSSVEARKLLGLLIEMPVPKSLDIYNENGLGGLKELMHRQPGK